MRNSCASIDSISVTDIFDGHFAATEFAANHTKDGDAATFKARMLLEVSATFGEKHD